MRNEYVANLMLADTAMLKRGDVAKIGKHFAKPAPKRDKKESRKESFLSRILKG